jgi:hypothetical protein
VRQSENTASLGPVLRPDRYPSAGPLRADRARTQFVTPPDPQPGRSVRPRRQYASSQAPLGPSPVTPSPVTPSAPPPHAVVEGQRVEDRSSFTHNHQSAALLFELLSLLNTWCVLEGLVGVFWYTWFAKTEGLLVQWHHTWLLFASLWLVYTADRWLDARGCHELELLTARHRVHARYRRTVFWSWLGVLASSLLIAGLTLTAGEWWSGLSLVGATTAYFGVIHARVRPEWFPKELAVAAIYCAGTTLFVWSNRQLSTSLLLGGALFLGLVLVNLLGIAKAERSIDAQHDTPSLALGAQRLAEHVPLASWTLSSAAVLFAVLSERDSASLFWSLSIAATASAVVFSRPLGEKPSPRAVEQAHALADLALLAPLVLVAT